MDGGLRSCPERESKSGTKRQESAGQGRVGKGNVCLWRVMNDDGESISEIGARAMPRSLFG